jgi:hypothetical protein
VKSGEFDSGGCAGKGVGAQTLPAPSMRQEKGPGTFALGPKSTPLEEGGGDNCRIVDRMMRRNKKYLWCD